LASNRVLRGVINPDPFSECWAMAIEPLWSFFLAVWIWGRVEFWGGGWGREIDFLFGRRGGLTGELYIKTEMVLDLN
jgi:hypothetical protein